MTNIAILGFGVVGSGVANLITENYAEVKRLGKDDVNVKYILDLRDFPDSPFADRVVHDFNVILNDASVSVVIETMGGSHPAYEFTSQALKSGKSVITSNKEVVANFGEEFLSIAEANGVSYRFEAAVGGGIPVISPLIGCVGQNKISEIRGILNGTTNYILTKMFTFGDSFDSALKEAQENGYAERNPDADILGTDAARKISILAALATGKLVATDKIHTEGITKIRKSDVSAAESIGCKIKLLGRCISDGADPFILVAPFMLRSDSPLATVDGVYNAVEVVASPLGNVMFYGQGAGAGATASAVVGDLMQTMRIGSLGMPDIKRSENIKSFSEFRARHYLAFDKSAESAVNEVFDKLSVINAEELAVITEEISEGELNEKLLLVEKKGYSPLSNIRLL